jgi:hypothetical protein
LDELRTNNLQICSKIPMAQLLGGRVESGEQGWIYQLKILYVTNQTPGLTFLEICVPTGK